MSPRKTKAVKWSKSNWVLVFCLFGWVKRKKGESLCCWAWMTRFIGLFQAYEFIFVCVYVNEINLTSLRRFKVEKCWSTWNRYGLRRASRHNNRILMCAIWCFVCKTRIKRKCIVYSNMLSHLYIFLFYVGTILIARRLSPTHTTKIIDFLLLLLLLLWRLARVHRFAAYKIWQKKNFIFFFRWIYHKT